MFSTLLSPQDYKVVGLKLFKHNNIPHIIYITNDAINAANYIKSSLEWHRVSLGPDYIKLSINYDIWLRRIRFEYHCRYQEFLTDNIAIIDAPIILTLSKPVISALNKYIGSEIRVGFSTSMLASNNLFYMCGSFELVLDNLDNRSGNSN